MRMSVLLTAICAAFGTGYLVGRLAGPEAFAPMAPPAHIDHSVEASASSVGGGEQAPSRLSTRASREPDLAAERSAELRARVESAPIPETLRERWRRQLGAAWRKESEGEAIPPEMSKALLEQLERTLPGLPESYVRHAWQKELQRRKFGTLEGHVEIVIGIASSRRLELPLVWAEDRAPQCTLQTQPLDLDADLPDQPQGYVRGGLIPEGKALIVESVELKARWGSTAARNRAELALVGLERGMEFQAAGGRLEAAWEGTSTVWAGYEPHIALKGENVIAQATIRGRVIPREAFRSGAQRLQRIYLRADGYMKPPPIRLQAAAHRRERVRVSLDAGRDRGLRGEGAYVPFDLFDAERDPASIQACRAHVEGRGRLPPGAELEVTGVRWRVRLDPEERAEVLIRVNHHEVLRTKHDGQAFIRGTWSGSERVRDRKLDDVYVELRGGAVADVELEGRIHEPRR